MGKRKNPGNAKSKQSRNGSSSSNHESPHNRINHSRQTDRIKIRRISKRDMDNPDSMELKQVHNEHQVPKRPDKGELSYLSKPSEDHDQYQFTTVTPGPSGQGEISDCESLSTSQQIDDEPNNMEY